MKEKCINRSFFHKEMCPDECTGHNITAVCCHYHYKKFPLGTLEISDLIDDVSYMMKNHFESQDEYCARCRKNCQECENIGMHHSYDILEKFLKKLAKQVNEETS